MKGSSFLRFLVCVLVCVAAMIGGRAKAQTAKEHTYTGMVVDSLTREPVPFANVSVAGGQTGTFTDENGRFNLKSKTEVKRLEISFIGYKDKYVRVIHEGKQGRIRLASDNMLEEVVVTKQKYKYKKKNNPAVDIVKMVLSRKDTLDARNADEYMTNCYRKQTLSVSQAEDFLRWRSVRGKNEELMRQTMDTSEVSGKLVIAIYTEESMNKLSYAKGMAKPEEEVLLEEKKALIDILPTDLVGGIMEDAADEINLYDNSFRLLFTEFVSPLANYGTNYYHYFIADTTYTLPGDTTKYIRLNFNPANAQNFGFVGEMLVVKDGSYGVKKVSMHLSKDSRINFVEAILIEQEFSATRQGYYTLRGSKLVMEGSPTEGKTKGKGVYARVERYYTPYNFGKDGEAEIVTNAGDSLITAKVDSALMQKRDSALLAQIDSALMLYGDTVLRLQIDSAIKGNRADNAIEEARDSGIVAATDSAMAVAGRDSAIATDSTITATADSAKMDIAKNDSAGKAMERALALWMRGDEKMWAKVDSALRANDDTVLATRRDSALRACELCAMIARGDTVVANVEKKPKRDPNDPWSMMMPENAPSRDVKDIGKLHDELNKTTQIKAINYLATMFANEHAPVGDIQDPWVWVGPLWSLVKSNHLEGIRVTLDVQTAPRLSKRWFFATMGAYGFGDKRWKCDLEVEYSFVDKEKFRNEFPRRSIALTYINDCENPGAEYSRKRKNRILTSVLSWQDPNEFIYFQRLKLWHMWEFKNGLSYKVHLQRNIETAADELEYRYNGNRNLVDNIKTTEYGIELSYRNVAYTQYGMRRFALTYQVPHFSLKYTGGHKSLWSDYTYNKTDFVYDQNVPVAPVGNMDIYFKAGKQWNKCPYPLLYAPPVNLSYITQAEQFFLMRNMEFLYDQYASLEVTHYMEGWLLSKIPLIKKLKWRELWTFRAMVSGLTDKNNPKKHPDSNELYALPEVSHTMSAVPYMEWGVGLYNVFKVIRVEYVRRITYLDNPNVRKWGIRAGLQINF